MKTKLRIITALILCLCGLVCCTADETKPAAKSAKAAASSATPEHGADGTIAHVDFAPVEGAASYNLWVSAHEDGRGATNMVAAGVKPGQLIWGLRPGIPLYYWLTYKDAKNQTSKPAPVHKEVLVDLFKEK